MKTGDNFNNLSGLLNSFIKQVNSITQDHLAYPALHYFHSSNKNTAIAPAVAILDEALSIHIVSYPDEYKDISILIDPTRDAIHNLLAALENSYIRPGEETPYIPDLNRFYEHSFGNILQHDIIKFYSSMAERRRILLAYVINNGWQWNDVIE